MKRNYPFALLLGAAITWGCNSGGDGDTTDDTTAGTSETMDTSTAGMNAPMGPPLNTADSTFVMEAANAGLMEVQAGNLAQQNGNSQHVKDYGAMMVRDHSAANDELKALASSRNMMLPDSLKGKDRDHIEGMKKMQGKAFDNHYVGMMVNDHQKVIDKFEKAANNANDADLKAWAGKTLPTLKAHLDSAKAMKKKM